MAKGRETSVLVLASSSPRRSQLLTEWGYEFRRIEAPVSETFEPGLEPEAAVRYLAEKKAVAGLKLWRDQRESNQDLVLGADTIVVLNNRILGKPKDEQEAEEMLSTLSGKTHRVMTAIALADYNPNEEISVWTGLEITTVTFKKLDKEEILAYIATGEPMDKAAAYGIQGKAKDFVLEIEGSLTNVIGLPMELLTAQLEERGIYPKR